MGIPGSTWQMFQRNAQTALLFEVVYKVILFSIVIPVETALLDLAMAAGGFSYLDTTNLLAFIASPVTWAILIVMVLFLAFYSLVEISALIALMHASRNAQTLRVRDTFALGGLRAARVVKRGNFGAVLFVLLLIPLTLVVATSNAVTDIHIPEFIESYIETNTPLWCVTVALGIFLTVLAFLWAFSLNLYTLQDMTFRESRKVSKQLVLAHPWFVLWRFATWMALGSMVAITISIGVSFATSAMFDSGMNSHLATMAGSFLSSAFNFALTCVATPLSYSFLNALFYRLMDMEGLPIPEALPQPDFRRRRIYLPLIVAGTSALALAGLLLGGASFVPRAEGMLKTLSSGTTCEVTAHRGGGATAPENTLAAFQNAIDSGADWVELDVQETADGVLVVMHDTNTLRTTGVNKVIWQTDYSDLSALDNGSWFSPEFSDVRICTLDEALKLCKGKVKMNIEIKPDGHNTDVEQKVVDLILENDMVSQTCVASLDYDTLVRVKEYDPEITTLYNMTVAYGDLGSIENVDIFSVDEAFVTPALVSSANEAGRRVFAWTVDDTSNMVKMCLYGVDSLVTDRVEEAESVCR